MQYDFSLSANGGATLDVKGKFFKYKSGTGLLRVRTDKGGFVDLLPGQGVWNVDFSRLMISDKSGAANTGILLAGEFDFHDDRISGSVEVIDGGKNRTIANQAFAGVNYVAASAGNIAHAQLWNPPGSGKNVIVESLSVSSLSGGISSDIRICSAVIGALGAQQPVPKLVGAQVGIAQYYTAQLAALSGSAGAPIITLGTSAAFLRDFIKFAEPVVLAPGQGIVSTANSGSALLFTPEWYEQTIGT